MRQPFPSSSSVGSSSTAVALLHLCALRIQPCHDDVAAATMTTFTQITTTTLQKGDDITTFTTTTPHVNNATRRILRDIRELATHLLR